MSLRTPDLHVEIAFANLNLEPIPVPGRPHWGSGLADLQRYAARIGFTDYEIHPTDRIIQEVMRAAKAGDTELPQKVIGSQHETFNEGTGLFGKLADANGIRRPLHSVGGMFYVQAVLNRPVVSVHLPTADSEARLPANKIPSMPSYPGSFPVAQPTATLYGALHGNLGLSRNDELSMQLGRKGMVGLCPDTEHARCIGQDGSTPPPIEETWAEQFASGLVYEAHMSDNRIDLQGRDPKLADKSHKEHEEFTSRHWTDALNTEKGDMITAAVENWVAPPELVAAVGAPVLRFVIETPPHPAELLTRVRQHGRLVNNLAEIVSHAGATPLLYGSKIT